MRSATVLWNGTVRSRPLSAFLPPQIAGQLAEPDFAVESVRGDYSGFESLWIAPGEFPHVIEIYDFPAVFKTDDLLDAFAEFR